MPRPMPIAQSLNLEIDDVAVWLAQAPVGLAAVYFHPLEHFQVTLLHV